MLRRHFLKTSVLWIGGAAVVQPIFRETPAAGGAARRFRLRYAPHFGMFKHSAGDDPIDQLKFAAEHGFAAWEDRGMKSRPVELQQKIATAMDSLGIEMGAFTAAASFQDVSFARKDAVVWQQVLAEVRGSVEVAKRVNARWMTVVPGHSDRLLGWDQQAANCVELLQRCCEFLEPEGLTMLLEPLAWCSNHPGCFLHSIPQAYQICRAVGSPACKILFDLSHQHAAGADLISELDAVASEVAYFQCGDNPGRKEPGTGRIDYRSVFQYIHAQGFRGIVGMDHGNSLPAAEGERAVIEAYALAEAF